MGILREESAPAVKKLFGKNTQKWVKFHLKHGAPASYLPYFVMDRKKPAIGPFCHDVDGNMFMDFASHIASSPLGYNNPEIVKLMQRMHSDPDRYGGTDFIAGYGADPEQVDIPTASHLHHKVLEITKQFGYDMSFLVNTGSEAIENAIKMCYMHRPFARYGICFEGGFHGRTLGALSLNRSKVQHRAHIPQIPQVIDLPYCFCRQMCICGWKTKSRTGIIENKLKQLLDPHTGLMKPDEVAYVMIEPVQGEGGFRFPREDFMREVYETAQMNGIPVISDEIQAGMGRTGKWWACENFGVAPDLLTTGKALRVAGVVGKKKYFPSDPGILGGTWAEGNAIASAVGYKTIEIIQKQHLLKNAQVKGMYFLNHLKDLDYRFDFITDARGIGLMLAIEFQNPRLREIFRIKCAEQGLILLDCGSHTLRILPPLDVSKREIDIAIEILERSCKQMRRQVL